MGKTQVALEYAYRSAEAYQWIIWLRAETRELLCADVVALAETLQVVTQEAQPSHECIKAVRRWLQEHRDWLLVVDNLEELALLREFLPATHLGSILVTTRVQAPGPG